MNDPPMLHPLETEIMEVIWDHGPVTVRQVVTELARREAKDRAYTTILTVCSRMTDKGMLTRSSHGQTGVFEPAISRDDYRAARAVAGVDALLEEAGDMALVHFARRFGELDPERRAALERLIYDE